MIHLIHVFISAQDWWELEVVRSLVAGGNVDGVTPGSRLGIFPPHISSIQQLQLWIDFEFCSSQMSSRVNSEDESCSTRKVAYVYSPEYIQTCDTLSKVPNRVRRINFLCSLKTFKFSYLNIKLRLVKLIYFFQASMVHSLIESYGLLQHMRWVFSVLSC